MPQFRYRARDKFGKLVAGMMEGDTVETCSERLMEADLVPIRIKAPGILSRLGHLFLGRVKDDELNAFTRQLATLQKSGIPLLSGMRALEEQTRNPFFKRVVRQIVMDLESGLSLNEALARHPSVYDTLYVNMVKAGESSGTLDQVLDRIAALNERNTETKRRIQAALRYPLITFCSMIIAFTVIVTFVIPRFAALFASFDVALPLPTRILLGVYGLVTNYWYALLATIVASIFLFRLLLKTPWGLYFWHRLFLRIPVLGSLLHEIYMSRFAINLATLLDSGLPILVSLDYVGDTVNNAVIKRAVGTIRQAVSGGSAMARPMRETGLFSPMVIQMIAIGEETGQVSHLLTQVSFYYDRESDLKIKNLTTLIEPFFIVVMGIMVLMLALGVFLPMWNIVQLYQQ